MESGIIGATFAPDSAKLHPGYSLQGDLFSDLRYTGHYVHAPSGLTLAPYRAYELTLGRWLNRDPIGEAGGINLYGYVGDNPLNLVDPLGLQACGDQGLFPGPSACGYYEKQCNESRREDKYACEAKKCCESFGDNFSSNCTRKCLIDQDKLACSKMSGTARDSCRKRAHYFCYSVCFNVADAVTGGFGTMPPAACKDAADAIGGMW